MASYTDLLLVIFKEPSVDFLADDLSSYVIFLCQTQSHLFKNELHFLSSLHGSKCLDLNKTKMEKESALNW